MSHQPAPERVRVSGPLAGFADGFRVDLLELGYSLWGAQEQLYLLAYVSRWMALEGLEVSALTPGNLERYFVWRRRQGYRHSLSPLSLRRLLGYLGGLDVLAPADAVLSSVDRLLGEFRDYLIQERGIKASSAAQYQPTARLFLCGRSEPLEDGLARLSAGEVNVFVLREARRRSVRSTETVIYALRALLRFLRVRGLIVESLAAAVPSVARRREDLPRALPAGEVKLLLDSCDRATPTGRRDYAIVLLLSRLGLRRCEVVALSLDDIDWRAGEIVVHGKGSRIDRLPLPCDVGEGIVDYLRDGRPRVADRALFINACAPLRGITCGCVTDVVRYACVRAGIEPVGAHRLRHTLATELLRHGAGLVEIGQVLRHQDQTTTSVYHAKNDRSRELPLHPTTVAALDRYVRARDELCPHPKDPEAFFLSGGGGRLSRHFVWKWFDELRRATGLDQETLGRRARLHDVRHSYVLRTLLGWYRDGGDIEARLPLLSTVLGHVHPADTFWYFEGAPELLALACERLERTWEEPSSTDGPTDAQARMPLSWERSRRRRPRQTRQGGRR